LAQPVPSHTDPGMHMPPKILCWDVSAHILISLEEECNCEQLFCGEGEANKVWKCTPKLHQVCHDAIDG